MSLKNSLSVPLTSFVLWTAFSWFCHYFASSGLQTVKKTDVDPYLSRLWYAAFLLTFIQTLSGILLLCPSFWSRRTFNFSTSPPVSIGSKAGDTNSNTKYGFPIIILCHLSATLCTNASMAFSQARSTFTIKAFEPVTTAVLVSILSGSKIELAHSFSLPLVILGALGFVYSPCAPPSSNIGIFLAFLSNLFFGLRNFLLKPLMEHNDIDSVRILGMINFFSSIPLLPICLLQSANHFSTLSVMYYFNFFHYCLASAACFLVYTVISTCFLLKVYSIISHAVGNLLKRVIVASIFYAISTHSSSWFNIASGFLLLLGLLVYLQVFPVSWNFDKNFDYQPFAISSVLFAFLLGLVCFHATGTSVSHPACNQTKSQNEFKMPSLTPATMPNLRPVYTYRYVDAYGESYLYRTNLSSEDIKFLSINFLKYPHLADRLSKKLKYAEDVVTEARRVHNTIFRELIGKFKTVILVNIFTWFNKGDQLITVGEREILRRFNLSLIYYCFYPGDDCDFSNVHYNEDTVVMIQGAGYIGHPSHISVVEKTVKAFPDNRIVVFPISVCYPTADCNDIDSFISLFGSHSDVNIILRDRVSFEKSQKFFSKNKVFLAPDSAFAVGFLGGVNMLPVYDIIWIKRNDWENFGDPEHDTIPPVPSSVSYIIEDWNENWMDQNGKDFFETHQLKAWSGLLYLARARVVITDRLHAHLMCTLMGKPNVVQNSRTRKQQNYFDTWEGGIGSTVLVNTGKEALEKALSLLKSP